MPQLVDLSGDVKTRRRESLHEEGAWARSLTSQVIGAGHLGFPQGRQATAGDNGGRGGGDSTDWGSLPPTRKLEEDTEVVSRSDGSRPDARLGHTQADHGGARGAIPRRNPPGGDDSHIRAALPN